MHIHIKNYMEDLVWNYLDVIIAKHPQVCNCEKCRYDIAALALNFLPPHYIVSDKGETYTKVKSLEQQFNVDLISAISQAIRIVTNKPRHEME
ncbi:hypothetical protein SDC9_05993 [bioreactor metagenome]|uniref:ComF operon protein 2 n=1 Tax=bioreactor metagenome TaxID=1076179 RepID=A0A644T2I4_9ZZZZ|nr:late competence development ComFB family protein [Negativicutes bacterium]